MDLIELKTLKEKFGRRLANPAEVLRLLNVGRKAVGLKPLAEIPKGSNPFRDIVGPLCALERAFPKATLGHDDDDGCEFCHCHAGYTIWGGGVDGKEAALARAWKTKIINTRGSLMVKLPYMLNQFSTEYATGMWPEFVDECLICLSDDDLDERIAKAQGIDVIDVMDLPDAISAGYDLAWMPYEKIANYLIPANDAKYLCGKAA